MGKIEFIGIVNDFFGTEMGIEESTSIPPENAHFINEEDWIDMSTPLNWLIIGIPIFAIILITMLIKQRKNGLLNKEVRNEYKEEHKSKSKGEMTKIAVKRFLIVFILFFIALLIIAPIHELIHCIAGALFGLDMKFGIDPQTFIGFAYTEEPLTKFQFLVMSLSPLVILGIIPLIILFIKYPKEKMSFKKALKYWILTCFIGTMFMTCAPDMIESFNFIKNIPNGAIVEENYWYIPSK